MIWFGLVWFYGISTIEGYLMTNLFSYINILDLYGLVWFGLVLWHIYHCWLFNDKFSSYIYSDGDLSLLLSLLLLLLLLLLLGFWFKLVLRLLCWYYVGCVGISLVALVLHWLLSPR